MTLRVKTSQRLLAG